MTWCIVSIQKHGLQTQISEQEATFRVDYCLILFILSQISSQSLNFLIVQTKKKESNKSKFTSLNQ